MRLCTALTIETLAIHKYQGDVMLYLGDRGGSIKMSMAEAVILRDQLSAVVPKPDAVGVESLIRAVLAVRVARDQYHAAKDEFDRQDRNSRLIRAEAAVVDAIAALKREPMQQDLGA